MNRKLCRAVLAVCWAGIGGGAFGGEAPYRAFTTDSYWNTPLPSDAPVEPRSAEFIQHLKEDNDPDYLILAGTQEDGAWGMPIYWAKPTDPRRVVKQKLYRMPPEATTAPGIRIPENAKPDPTSDGELAIFDTEAGRVYTFWIFTWNRGTKQCEAAGGDVFYLNSNGLDGRWKQFKDTNPRNVGAHRGICQGTTVIRYDEIMSGQPIEHAFKIAIRSTAASHVFPMTGDEGGPGMISEGARIRIKPGVDLSKKGLSPAALTVATALQKYGAVVGDRGGQVSLKVENMVAQGRGWLWKDVLAVDSLESIPLDDYEFIRLGWGEHGEWLK